MTKTVTPSPLTGPTQALLFAGWPTRTPLVVEIEQLPPLLVTTNKSGEYTLPVPPGLTSDARVVVYQQAMSAKTKITVAPPAPPPPPSPAPPAPALPRLYGTLLTDPTKAAAEYAAGLRIAHLDVGWDRTEPQDGVFDNNYIQSVVNVVTAYRGAGLDFCLGLCPQYDPPWVKRLPNGEYTDQYGRHAGPPNLVFSGEVQARMDRLIHRVVSDIGPSNIATVRLGAGGGVECLYPSDMGTNSYWCYDAGAQTICPYPGWRPGDKTLNGQAFTEDMVEDWYRWYVRNLARSTISMIQSYEAAGFKGRYAVLMPGLGTRPVERQAQYDSYLDGSQDGNRTTSRGAMWDIFLDNLMNMLPSTVDRSRLIYYVSSLGDGSGGDDLVQPGDSSVSLYGKAILDWSAARWSAYNAGRYGLQVGGENPGDRGYLVVQKAVAQFKSFGTRAAEFYLAHDQHLWDGQEAGLTLDAYKGLVAQG